MTQAKELRSKMLAAESCLQRMFPERDEVIRGLMLSMICRAHIFIMGPPGTAKTTMIKVLFSHIADGVVAGNTFNPATKEDAVFGPISVRQLRENDRYIRVTSNETLPNAHIYLGDEIWKLNPAILHTLLNPLSPEREWNNPGPVKLPLRSFVGASNELPAEDCHLEALYDRFALRYFVDDVKDTDALRSILFGGLDTAKDIASFPKLSIADFEAAESFVKTMSVSEAFKGTFVEMKAKLELEGFKMSTRRWGVAVADTLVTGDKMASLAKAYAFLNGRDRAEPEDLSIVAHSLWETPKQLTAIRGIIDEFAIPAARMLFKRCESLIDSIQVAIQSSKFTEDLFDDVSRAMKQIVIDAKTFTESAETSEANEVRNRVKAATKVFKEYSVRFQAATRGISL